MAADRDPKAPHGRDDMGVPLAPYGYKADGDPRVSNRGRTAAAPKKKGTTNTKSGSLPKTRTQSETKTQLMELSSFISTPLALLSGAAPVRARIGDRHADALAGDAVIVESFAEPVVDFVMYAARSRPGILAWMDAAEDAAPFFMAAKIAGGLVKAIAQNHMNPDPQLAAAGRKLPGLRAAQYAVAIEREAAELEAAMAELAAMQEAAEQPVAA